MGTKPKRVESGKPLSGRRTTRSLTGLLILCALAGCGQIWRDRISRKNAEGNALYDQKDYPRALEKYVEAQDGKNHQQALAYNLANTLYQEKKYPEAIKEFERAVSKQDPALTESVYFNRGNALFQMGKYQEAVDAYQQALELNPGDRDAKHNLELALKKLQENPKDKKNKADQKDSKQDKSQEKKDQSAQQKPDKSKDHAAKQEPQKSNPQPEQQQSQPSKSSPQQDQNGPQAKQKPGMDAKQALRILDALNQQEKQEQRKQALRIQRQRTTGKDW